MPAATRPQTMLRSVFTGVDRRPLLRAMAWTVAMAATYAIAARISLAFVIQPEGIAAIWPPAGLSLGALLISPRRHWPGLLAGVAVAVVGANLSAGVALPASLGFAAANTLEPLLAAAALQRWVGR